MYKQADLESANVILLTYCILHWSKNVLTWRLISIWNGKLHI